MQSDDLSPTAELTAIQTRLRADDCQVFGLDSEDYNRTTNVWNGAVSSKPALVVRCSKVSDVQACLRAADIHRVPISVRGGGYGWDGRCLRHRGLVLDLSGMCQVFVDFSAKEVTIAGGALASDVADALGSSSLVAVMGNAGAIGMAGLITGGGYGPLTPRFGLACDSLIQAEVVLADGRLVQASENENADLFWALRGGGGNFGVVTSMRVRLHEPGPIMTGVVQFPWAEADRVLTGYGQFVGSAPDELHLAVAMSDMPDGQRAIMLAPTWTGDPEKGQRIISDLQSLGTPTMARFAPATLSQMFEFADAFLPPRRCYEIRTRWLDVLSPDAISTLIEGYEKKTSPLSKIVLVHFHGAGTCMAPQASAFGMRREHHTAIIYASWEPGDRDYATHRRWAENISSRLESIALPGGYANLLTSEAHDQIAAAYGPNGERLTTLKSRFDPNDRFSAIPLPRWSGSSEARPVRAITRAGQSGLWGAAKGER